MPGQVCGCYKLEGLMHDCRCMQCPLLMLSTTLTIRSTIPSACRSLQSTLKVVVETTLEYDPRTASAGCLASPAPQGCGSTFSSMLRGLVWGTLSTRACHFDRVTVARCMVTQNPEDVSELVPCCLLLLYVKCDSVAYTKPLSWRVTVRLPK